MGLDVLDLFMRVERTFDITIPDEDAERLYTVGDLHRYILGKVPLVEREPGQTGPSICLSGRAFYRLRRVLVDGGAGDRRAIRPAALVEGLIPIAGRRRRWAQVEGELGWGLPPLVRPRWVVGFAYWLLGVLMVPMFVASVALLGGSAEGFVGAGAALVAFAVLYGFAAYKITTPLATLLPDGCVCMRDLVEQLVVSNYGKLRKDTGGWGRPEEIWESLLATLVDVLGIPPESISEESRFLEDLDL
jgi:acyl carrier protein